MIPIEVYRKEIFDFLKTVTIKFHPFANQYKNLVNNCDADTRDDFNNPYYRNLNGEYSFNDTPMYITTIEDGSKILLSKDNLKNYPRTAEIYRVPNIEFDILCDRYPNQQGLIKSIIYPAQDLSTVVFSPNLTLLAYDKSLLHTNERENMVEYLKEFLEYINERWYVKEFVYEELYAPVVWSVIWYTLPLVLLSKRVSNIRTSDVHPFHIWEYLCSKGLKNFSNILTNKQSLWLYRNINYIYKNQGKSSNLLYLSDNLLSDISVTLVGKTIYQQNLTKVDECITTPEYISEEVVSYEVDKKTVMDPLDSFESVQLMNNRLYHSDLEIKDSQEYVNQIEEEYGLTINNILPTKLVEIQKNLIDNRYEDLLTEFLLDSFVYRYSIDKLTYRIDLNDPVSGNTLNLSIGESIALLHWVTHRSLQEVPIYVPNKYISRIAYDIKNTETRHIPSTIWYLNNDYKLSDIVNIDTVLKQVRNINKVDKITSREKFAEFGFYQFEVLQHHIRQVRTSGTLLYHKGMCQIYDELMVHRELNLDLISYNTFNEWFESNETLKAVIDAYEELPTPSVHYDALSTNLLRTILPMDHELFRKFTPISDDMTELYVGLKNLFIQLCSYNITFLDTSRIKLKHVFTIPLVYNPEGVDRESELTYINWFKFNIYGHHENYLHFLINNLIPDEGHEFQSELSIDCGADIINDLTVLKSMGKYYFGSKIKNTHNDIVQETVRFPLLTYNVS